MPKRALIIGICLLTLLIGGSLIVTFFYLEKNERTSAVSSDASELRLLKSEWVTLIENTGPEAAYAEFLEGAETRALKPHDQAHAFGEALYDTQGLNGFLYCDVSFEFGCYHSYFGTAISHEGISVLPLFDQFCKDMYGEEDTSCQHGIGHGVMFYTGYDNLVGALELCEIISKNSISGCTNGLFMEYNFHTMEGDDDYLREQTNNPHEPCDVLPVRFQAACYYDQVQWWESLYARDYEKISNLCDALWGNRSNFEACYKGIGKYIASFYETDVESILIACHTMESDETRALCSEGAAEMFVTNPNRRIDVKMLCEALLQPYRLACIQKLLP